MHMLKTSAVTGLIGVGIACWWSDYNARVFHPWGCENARQFNDRIDEYKHVLLVCIDEDHWEDRGPNRYSLHHTKATVVRAYKGDWRVSEKIAFVQGFDYRAPTNAPSAAGCLGLVFTSEHADTEIGLDTGEYNHYDAEYAAALNHVFSQKSTR